MAMRDSFLISTLVSLLDCDKKNSGWRLSQAEQNDAVCFILCSVCAPLMLWAHRILCTRYELIMHTHTGNMANFPSLSLGLSRARID
jgi:hypothetical protein